MTARSAPRDLKPSGDTQRRRFALDANVEQLARVQTRQSFGTTAVGTPTLASGSLPMPPSYPIGGVEFDPAVIDGLTSVRLSPVSDGAGGLYTFEFNGVANIVIYLNSVEVVGLTDLTFLGPQPWLATGTESSDRRLYTASDGCVLQAIEVTVTSSFLRNATNYWSLQTVVENAQGRQEVTDAITLDDRGLAAGSPLRLVLDLPGFTLLPGDSVYLSVIPVGQPAPLVDLTAWPDIIRRVD